jgi:alpha-tubulin suppressor-like RCC1 family protein
LVIVQVGAGGKVSLFNSNGNTHLIVDVFGWFPGTTPPVASASLNIGKIAGGPGFMCAITDTNAVQCWGDNGRGQLGDGQGFTYANIKRSADPVPRAVVGLSNISRISSGDHHTCALRTDGAVFCWGSGTAGEIGDGNTSYFAPPTQVPISNAIGIAAGLAHSCALLADRTVKCWGSNYVGEVGVARTSTPILVPTLVPGVSGVVSIEAGNQVTCALIDDGTVTCWGQQFMFKINDPVMDPSPKRIPNVSGVAQLSVGTMDICVLTLSGQVQCWGGQQRTVQTVSGLESPSSISAGQRFDCATTGGGDVTCWGKEASLGQPIAPIVKKMPGLSAVQYIGVAAYNLCARQSTRLFCTGTNGNGELGNAAKPGSTTVPQPIGIAATGVAIGSFSACASMPSSASNSYCWGTDYSSPSPVLVPIAAGTGFAASFFHSCLVTPSGDVKCKGSNGSMESGQTTLDTVLDYTIVSGVSNATKVVVGAGFSCALINSGTIKCWGSNDSGKLGTGAPTSLTTPIPGFVSGITSAKDVYAGYNHACAVLTDGMVKCWGSNNNGEITGTVGTFELLPQTNSLFAGATSLALGSSFTCGVLPNTKVGCVGTNTYSQIGQGFNSFGPAAFATVVGVIGAKSIAAGPNHVCAAFLDGTVTCWGAESSALGSPATVPGLSGITWVAGGNSVACAGNGSQTYCWGSNEYGRLGDGSGWFTAPQPGPFV